MMHKTDKDEDFPVCFLASGELRTAIATYYTAARFADDVADNPFISSQDKLQKLEAVRQAFLHPDQADNLPIIRKLSSIFVAHNLDRSLYLDLLRAFEQDSDFSSIRVFQELIQYCRYSAAPVGRFMLALYQEHPMTYLPGENLCIVLQILNHLGHIKDDLSWLKRCYIPLDMIQSHGLKTSDFGLSYSSVEVINLLHDLAAKTSAMLADAQVLPRLIKNFRLRFEVCVILSLTNSVLKQCKNRDILQNPPRPDKWTWMKSIIVGLWRALFRR